MIRREKIRLSRRLERGLNQLYKEQKRLEKQAKKYQRQAEKIRKLRKLLLEAKTQLWLQGEYKWQIKV